MNRKIKINESHLKQIVTESVKKILKEIAETQLEKMFPIGGNIMFKSKNNSTGGNLKNIIKKGNELIFAFSDERGIVVSNDLNTLNMLKTGHPKMADAALVTLQNGRIIDVIEWDGYATYI